ncbi:hypothetical protein [Streptomyces roseicoloratus]|uniref:Hydrogenase expression protein HypF n=1 Tax=Streptomyces roseicoloratus TaxID=2508722 RepID=A0ABY9RTB4_9ACTN|nr:hypothetical protein [Streptomyces roseicoloratus]WMX44978.1 hypothetical protein RGF97_09120 [Streptomyces roseicoloratus]
MRGDETQSAGTTRGPRHAAPRKSLLNKLHAPVGKAMALAAMPTAVIVGMGLAPRLALADDNKDIPFAPGPCVTRSDEPTPEESSTTPAQTESPKPTASASATGQPEPETSASATAEPKPTATSGTATAVPQAPAPHVTPTASPTPTATKSKNPLDPLGLGDALKDLFDGPDKTTAAPEPTATTAAPTPAPTATTGTPDGRKPTTAPERTTAPKTDTVTDRTKEAIKAAADKAGATTEELSEDVKGLDPKKDEDIPDGAKPRFPCPEPDPEALAAAELESGMPLLPDEPWRLETSTLELRGLKYHGIVEVKTGSGKIKKALKFTADEVDIWNLHQLTVHSEGLTGHVRSDTGSKSTIRNGTVTMYTEELKGNLFGIIPVTFSPETPPPLDVPWAVFTNCKVKQAGQFGGTLKVPGLRNTIEPN